MHRTRNQVCRKIPLARSVLSLPAAKRLSEKSLSLNFYIKLKIWWRRSTPNSSHKMKCIEYLKSFYSIEQNIIYVPNILMMI